MNMRHQLESLEWIAKLTPENCPGGLPKDERGWRDLVNRIVKDVREVLRESDGSDSSDKSDLSDCRDPYETAKATPEVAANTVVCLIHQATYLLKRQMGSLEKAFLEEGGFTERLYKKRQEFRKNQGPRR